MGNVEPIRPQGPQGGTLKPMSANVQERPLKVCLTCRFWSTRHKGFCQRLGQGVGRFYSCTAWTMVSGPSEARAPGPLATAG
jgi:hypothetical protein